MGDRALIQFKDTRGEHGPVVYLHWHGSGVNRLLNNLSALMEDRRNDLAYATARFIGICHNEIDGNLSLGVENHPRPLTPEDTHGDAGCFIIDCNTWEVNAFGGYGLRTQ